MKLETKTRRERIIAKGDVSVKQYYMENRGVGFNINWRHRGKQKIFGKN